MDRTKNIKTKKTVKKKSNKKIEKHFYMMNDDKNIKVHEDKYLHIDKSIFMFLFGTSKMLFTIYCIISLAVAIAMLSTINWYVIGLLMANIYFAIKFLILLIDALSY